MLVYTCGTRSPEVGLQAPAYDAALVGAGDLDVVAADPAGQRERARRAARRSRSAGSPSRVRRAPGSVPLDLAALGTASSSCSAVELLEQEERAAARCRRARRRGSLIELLQVAVDEHDGHGALTDGGRHALDRLGPHVAGHEHAGHAGLQVVRRPVERPAARAAARRRAGRARSRTKPRASRASTGRRASRSRGAPMNTNSQLARRPSPSSPVDGVAQDELLEVVVAVRRSTTSVRVRTSMLAIAVDLLDQVVRHRRARGTSPRTSSVTDLACREKNTAAWPGGVGAADDVDVLACAGGRLGRRRAVVDAAAGELVEPGRVELPVGDAGGQDDRVRGDLGAVGEPDDAGRAADLEPDDVARGEDLGAELGRLPPGPVGELGARTRRRGSRGSSRSASSARPGRRWPALDQHGAQALGRAVHGRAEPGRAAADDDEVVEVGRRAWSTGPTCAASSAVGRARRRAVPSGVTTSGSASPSGPPRPSRRCALRLVGGEPAVGHLVAGQEVAHLGRAAPTSGARRPWSRSTGRGRRPATPRAGRRRPGRASPPAGPTA